MLRSTRYHVLFASMAACFVAIVTWSVATAYVTYCCKWPDHYEEYTIHATVPSTFHSAIHSGASAWTNTPASTWTWASTQFGWSISYVPIDGSGPLTDYARTVLTVANGTTIVAPLVQWYWRGSEGRTRQVPIINGSPSFANAEPWSGVVTTLPGTGTSPLQALAYVAVGNKVYQELWRDNTRWTREIPIVGGIVLESSATPWVSGLSQHNFGTMPNTTPPLPSLDVQVNNYYVLYTTLKQQFWRNDKGFFRDIPISNGVPQWSSAGAWQGPVPLSNITAGSGSLQAYSTYRVGNKLQQALWRNNLGYIRDVPLINNNCTENWNGATAWNTTGIPISNLLGSGDMRGQDNYELSQ